MAERDPILRMRGITKDFNGVRALDDVSLEVTRGEVHAICGENGAGKSTLMKVLSGVYPHGTYTGTIELNGADAAFTDINASEASGIVIIHQELALNPLQSIAENIFLGNERARRGVINWDRTTIEAGVLLKKVGLKENPATKIFEIGVGKQQLIEIAKAMAKDVSLLILDEPTAALNDEDSDHLLELIAGMRDHGITCILISHKLREVRRIADRVTVLRDGKTIETIDMSDPDASEGRIIKAMVGRELNNLFPPHEPQIGREMFRVEDWTAYHPIDTGRIVVDHASFNVHAGEIVGFAGLMGAGRTELAMSLFGRLWGTNISGRVFKDGQEISTATVDEAVAHGIAYVTEDRKRYGLNLIGMISTNISAVALAQFAKWGIIDRNREYLTAEDYRRSMNIKTPSVSELVGRLSGGNQQKVVLSKWLVSGPDVLILDEPTRGIDVGAKYEIYGLINQLAEQGKAVVMISSELPELLGMCDRIYAISEGAITGDLRRVEATQENLMYLMTMGKEELR
ncbi:multiple monosaccharide ABC transporter ATP-binding protein [Propionicimonas sp.]|uniref:multiple monosaccharide ABC transporter ATP-binding protein n=1 Tax=Propionicimonas sp. TaxID=1955623 RepID=UPI0017DDA88B|nr:multiple monosaccharide ABC transporter ATP-binding protein [Propionicimonas sp.]MBU3977082.1 ATP-binding cassette domain-containing protein [Actinomycetota bacterium]MBA3020651.1 ATP-binding cassette domain-containing protein [Propionicimonas sp.]MBU3985022.1 ATP-binding cassette domain-containing protein [Actinomycetota bacterium]MBU4007021.1 ATP-binding cassette domain-containing protein [Actinomycetota bacterium]MBU4064774.1 ATP-binding cassette domain-containing protein [Actinomycetota